MEGSLVAYKIFTNGSVLNGSEINENLMQQSIAVFSSAAARTAAITSPVQGQTTYIEADDLIEFWDGSAWVGLNRNLQNRNVTLSALNTFTNQTTFADFPIAADKSALDMTFVKKRASSSLLVTIDVSFKFAAGTAQIKTMALNIAGTDYAIANTRPKNSPDVDAYMSGSNLLSGVAAGSLAVKPRFKTASASGDDFAAGLIVSYSVEEIF
jgi:hypothetical protein